MKSSSKLKKVKKENLFSAPEAKDRTLRFIKHQRYEIYKRKINFIYNVISGSINSAKFSVQVSFEGYKGEYLSVPDYEDILSKVVEELRDLGYGVTIERSDNIGGYRIFNSLLTISWENPMQPKKIK